MTLKTKSVCPFCLKVIDAKYLKENDKIYLYKECGEHGAFKSLASEDEAFFKKHSTFAFINIAPKKAAKPVTDGCPYDCGLCENHKQTACCVLLEVTQRCNQKCPYCFADANQNAANDPCLNEIASWYDKLIELGEERKFNIQLSGGEPTVRDDLPEIVSIGKQKGFEYIQLNTNGKRLGLQKDYAQTLKDAGVSVVFLQFDGTNDCINLTLRSEKLFDIKKQAIENCRRAGLPVTLVPTITPGVNVDNIGELFEFMLKNMPVVRGIHFQPVSYFGRYPHSEKAPEHITLFKIINELVAQSGDKLKADMFFPLQSGHPMCSFYGTFLKNPDGSIKSMHLGTKEQSQSCDCCCPSTALKIIKKDRDFVKNKWSLPSNSSEALGFDAFLSHIKNNSFTITAMAFMDAYSLDLSRLERCRVHIFSKNKTLVPFCAYNLTDCFGKSLYR